MTVVMIKASKFIPCSYLPLWKRLQTPGKHRIAGIFSGVHAVHSKIYISKLCKPQSRLSCRSITIKDYYVCLPRISVHKIPQTFQNIGCPSKLSRS